MTRDEAILEVQRERVSLQALGLLEPEEGAWKDARPEPVVMLASGDWHQICVALRRHGYAKAAARIEIQCGVAPK